jgi:hypothetical protein
MLSDTAIPAAAAALTAAVVFRKSLLDTCMSDLLCIQLIITYLIKEKGFEVPPRVIKDKEKYFTNV